MYKYISMQFSLASQCSVITTLHIKESPHSSVKTTLLLAPVNPQNNLMGFKQTARSAPED